MTELTDEQVQTIKHYLETVGQSRPSSYVDSADVRRAFDLAGVLPPPPLPPDGSKPRDIVREDDVTEIHVEVTPEGYWRLGEEHSFE